MKLNNKFRRGIASLCAAVLLFILFSFPVLAADVSFIDPFDYSEISYWTDNQGVSYHTRLPRDWFSTLLLNPTGRAIAWIDGSSFTWTDPGYGYQYLNWFMHPLGDRLSYWPSIGEKTNNGKVISLSGIPRDSMFQGNIVFDLKADEGFDGLNTSIAGEVGFIFVDKDYNVVFRHSISVPISWITVTSYELYGGMSFYFNFKDLGLPASAVGLIPIYYLSNVPWYPSTVFSAEYNFSIGFSMSALQLEAQKSDQIQNTLDSINSSMNDMVNGTPDQNQQVDDALGSLNGSADELEQLGDSMSNVDKPDLNSSDFSANALVPQTSLTTLAKPIQALWENHTLLAMLTIVVSLVLVSWVFFGKKG